MTLRNIRYSKSTEIENGQTIEFECEEGLVSDNGLEAICINKQIQYPRCYAGRKFFLYIYIFFFYLLNYCLTLHIY